MGHDDSGHPGKAELRRQLLQAAKHLGLELRDVDHLVESARIVEVGEEKQICSSLEQDGMVNFMIRGVAAVYLHQRETPQRQRRPSLLKLVGRAEFFCLATPPRDESYYVRAVTYPRADKQGKALVALWARAALFNLVNRMRPSGTFLLLETSWKMLSRVGEEQGMLIGMTLKERLEYLLPRLAHRFGQPHELGILIDLWLPDDRLGVMVSGERAAVNKTLAKLPEVTRVGPGLLVMRSPQIVQP